MSKWWIPEQRRFERSKLQSYGDVSTLYTATKGQGQVMVTFYSSLAAGRAFTALQGRTVHGRELQVDFHFSQKDAQAGKSERVDMM